MGQLERETKKYKNLKLEKYDTVAYGYRNVNMYLNFEHIKVIKIQTCATDGK